MDLRRWPVSATSTRLLLDLCEHGSVVTTPKALAALAVKELMLRGSLRTLELERRGRWRGDVLLAGPGDVAPSSLPRPLHLLGREIDRTPDELAWMVRRAARRNRHLFTRDLRDDALGDLTQRGLAAPVESRRLGVRRTTRHEPTAGGRARAEEIRAALDRAYETGELAALGALVLLVPDGIGRALREGRADPAGPGVYVGPSAPAEHDADGEGFHVFAALDDAFGAVLDGVGDGVEAGLSAIDSALDAVTGSIDAAIDSSVDAGVGGDGGSGGGD